MMQKWVLFSPGSPCGSSGLWSCGMSTDTKGVRDTRGAEGAQEMGATGCASLHHPDMQNEPKILAEEAEGDSL